MPSYTTGTFTATGVGFSDSVTGTATYVQIGQQVTLKLPELAGTSNATTFTITGLLAALAPFLWSERFATLVNTNGTFQYGLIDITGTVLTVHATPAFGAWVATGTKAIYAPSVTYIIV